MEIDYDYYNPRSQKEQEDELIISHGWTFVPEHDIPTEFGQKVCPECYVHEVHPTQWSREDVLEFIDQQILLGIESQLE